MANWTKEQIADLRQQQKRELFCKAVNSMLMTDAKKPLKDALTDAKTIVDTAFKSYPSLDEKNKQEEDLF